jgi:hypothetical protein
VPLGLEGMKSARLRVRVTHATRSHDAIGMTRKRPSTLNEDRARALGSALIVLSWKLAQGGRQIAAPIDSKRIEELVANAVSKRPAPTRAAAAPVGKTDRWAKRGALVAGLTLLIVLASTSIRVSPTQGRWIGSVGFIALITAAAVVRTITRRAVASTRRIPARMFRT